MHMTRKVTSFSSGNHAHFFSRRVI